VPAFENVHIYHTLATVLGITPSANDGDPAVARRLLRLAVPAPLGSAPPIGAVEDPASR
jgi:hypothetical protein